MTVLAQDDFSSAGSLFGASADVGTWDAAILWQTGADGTEAFESVGGQADIYKNSPSSGQGSFAIGISGTQGNADHLLTAVGAYDPEASGHTGLGAMLFCRYGSSTAYVLAATGTTWTIYRFASATYTQVAQATNGATRCRLRVEGSSPTALKARFWTPPSGEPSTWDIDTTENTAGNQRASGSAGIGAFVNSATAEPGGYTVDDYLVETIPDPTTGALTIMLGGGL